MKTTVSLLTLLTLFSDQHLRRKFPTTTERQPSKWIPGDVLSVVFNPDGQMFASGSG